MTENRRAMRSSIKSCHGCSTCSFITNTSCNTCVSIAMSVDSRSAGMLPRPTANANNRSGNFISGNKEMQQRVASARRLEMNSLKNELTDAIQAIADKDQELRTLRTQIRRYEAALNKYESHDAELPKLMHSHAEELRSLKAKCRSLMAERRDLKQKITQKDFLILQLQDENKYLTQLTKEKDLEDRHRLKEKLEEAELQIKELENDNKVMAHKAYLEVKVLKQQLRAEQLKNKEYSYMQLNAENALNDFISGKKFKNKTDAASIGSTKTYKIDDKTFEKQRDNQDDSLDELEARELLRWSTLKRSSIPAMNLNDIPNTDSFMDYAEKPLNVKQKGHGLNKTVREGLTKSTPKLPNDDKIKQTQEAENSSEDDYENVHGRHDEHFDPMLLLGGNTPTGTFMDSKKSFKPPRMPGSETPLKTLDQDCFAPLFSKNLRRASMRLVSDFINHQHFLDIFGGSHKTESPNFKGKYAPKPAMLNRKHKWLAPCRTVEEGGN